MKIFLLVLLWGLTCPALPNEPTCSENVAAFFVDGRDVEVRFFVVEREGKRAGQTTTVVFTASTNIRGETLHLGDVVVLEEGATFRKKPWRKTPRQVRAGAGVVREGIGRLCAMARAAGFRELVIEGRRDTGSKKSLMPADRTWRRSFDLN